MKFAFLWQNKHGLRVVTRLPYDGLFAPYVQDLNNSIIIISLTTDEIICPLFLIQYFSQGYIRVKT